MRIVDEARGTAITVTRGQLVQIVLRHPVSQRRQILGQRRVRTDIGFVEKAVVARIGETPMLRMAWAIWPAMSGPVVLGVDAVFIKKLQ